MNQDFILSEIRRAAAENGGQPLGIARFEELTGIAVSIWRGRFWATWGEATADAAIQPGRMNEAFESDFLLTLLAELARSCGRFPTSAETRMARAKDKNFPDFKVFDRFGSKAERIEALRSFVSERGEFANVLPLLPTAMDNGGTPQTANESADLGDGFVYMMKLGKAYKIGKTFSVPRRHREIALELPQKPDVVHTIRTDDPDGIEAYWHRRFESKRTSGEWFSLDVADVKAFKRRKFM
ncbi:MAG: GIY-YIG nuclease family protein [Pseudomonadota bacterium]|nr:GIY-YIG nuclease family protein [Pseudomonadota bacterium]